MNPREFENQTTLPVTKNRTQDIIISEENRASLQFKRKKFKQDHVTFKHDLVIIPNEFISSTSGSFECVTQHNNATSTLPRLTPGIKQPDEYYLHIDLKTAFIIEKKYQQTAGSVDEKIQGADFKQFILRKKFNSDWNVFYMFCFSDWLKNGYSEELDYLRTINVPVFWGQCADYHTNILTFIKDKTTAG